jgi:hypothetical protein
VDVHVHRPARVHDLDENGYFDWQRPQRALRTHVSCGTERTLMFEGVALFTPSGMLRVVCVEPA